MSKYQNQLVLALSMYLRLYLLLGVIELTLREVIPATLSKGSKKQSEKTWLNLVRPIFRFAISSNEQAA